jgi:hypothetical protein
MSNCSSMFRCTVPVALPSARKQEHGIHSTVLHLQSRRTNCCRTVTSSITPGQTYNGFVTKQNFSVWKFRRLLVLIKHGSRMCSQILPSLGLYVLQQLVYVTSRFHSAIILSTSGNYMLNCRVGCVFAFFGLKNSCLNFILASFVWCYPVMIIV